MSPRKLQLVISICMFIQSAVFVWSLHHFNIHHWSREKLKRMLAIADMNHHVKL